MSSRETRKQLKQFSTINDFLDLFEKAKKIVFITGAGVSVSCGIPDFRSASGIYNTMECQEIGIPSPELLFDLEFFLMDSAPFYKYAHNLMPTTRTPSPAHHFISLLESRKKLLRNYTQNIDGLEKISGQKKVIECHGSMDYFQCLDCRKKIPRKEVHDTVMHREIPYCSSCKGIMVSEMKVKRERKLIIIPAVDVTD
jgi:NAD-dependent SIR2 family protein deacetylase